MRRKGRGTATLAAFVLAASLGATPARAGYLGDAGWGSLTVLTNIVYMPVKITYAVLGGVTGGLALALTGGDMKTAETVWVTTMGGTYVVTPRMLQGEDPIAFVGDTTTESTESTADTGGSPGLEERDVAGTEVR